MKVLLLLFSLFFTISCSLSEETQQTSELNTSELNTSELNILGSDTEMDTRMVRGNAWKNTLFESDISGSDWRDSRNSLKNNSVWTWLIQSNQHRSFNYPSSDGSEYWFNYTFFNDRKDVWYSIVRDGIILQTGWTTVTLLERRLTYAPGRYSDYTLVKFDVEFHPETRMRQILMVQRKQKLFSSMAHRGVIWAGGTEDFGLESVQNKIGFERGNFYVQTGHIQGEVTYPPRIENDISGSDWRDSRNSLKNNSVWTWLLGNDQYRSFNYYSSNGSKYWFSYMFDNNKKNVAYTIVRDGRILQTGWTTVTLLERRLTYAPGRYSDYGLIKFDVKFHPDTHMRQILMVQRKQKLFSSMAHRGVIWAGGTEDFGLESVQNKIDFEKGNFYVQTGAIGVK